MSDREAALRSAKYLVDPYLDWARAEGAPIAEGAALDLLRLDVDHWPRFGMKGAICHIDGRCDFLTAFLFELAPGAASAPVRHVYEEACYVLAGEGETDVTLSNGATHTIAWGARRLFAPPVNAQVRHRNAGATPARFVSLNDCRYLMGLYRNDAFLFANGAPMRARQDRALAAGLLADPLAIAPGAGELTPIPLADMTIGADLTQIAPGAAPARRQMQGRHILGLDGDGATFSYAEDGSELTRTVWRHGVLAGLAPMRFHQHVNAGSQAARLLSVEMGSLASPMFRSRRAIYGDTEVYASGAATLPRGAEPAPVRTALDDALLRTSA